MAGINDIVITGLGCVTPIGVGCDSFGDALLAGKCGVGELHVLDGSAPVTLYGATVRDFDAKQYVTPRKALKVMSREVQTAYSAAHLAWTDANFDVEQLAPDRVGVVYGSEMIPGELAEVAGAVQACKSDGQFQPAAWGSTFGKQIYPLWMLKNLPNMPACHVGIAADARGPNNTIALEEVSSLLALNEAAMMIERDQADVMIVGGVGGRISPTRLVYRLQQFYDRGSQANGRSSGPRCRPFDTDRAGIVPGEAAATLILERRSHAVGRQARILGRVCGFASRWSAPAAPYAGSRQAIASAAAAAMQAAGVQVADLDHINAQGFSQAVLDIEEAQAIRQVAPNTPVTALSSYFGTCGAAAGLQELLGSLMGLSRGRRLPTLGHEQTDERCPVQVCQEQQSASSPYFLKLSYSMLGHAAAAVIECEN